MAHEGIKTNHATPVQVLDYLMGLEDKPQDTWKEKGLSFILKQASINNYKYLSYRNKGEITFHFVETYLLEC